MEAMAQLRINAVPLTGPPLWKSGRFHYEEVEEEKRLVFENKK